MKNALEIFTEWVKENIKSTGDFFLTSIDE